MFSGLLNWQGAEFVTFHVCRLTAFFNCAKILSSPPIQSRTADRNVEPMTTVDMEQPFRPIPCFIHSQIVTM
jgi:hypothetical protein